MRNSMIILVILLVIPALAGCAEKAEEVAPKAGKAIPPPPSGWAELQPLPIIIKDERENIEIKVYQTTKESNIGQKYTVQRIYVKYPRLSRGKLFTCSWIPGTTEETKIMVEKLLKRGFTVGDLRRLTTERYGISPEQVIQWIELTPGTVYGKQYEHGYLIVAVWQWYGSFDNPRFTRLVACEAFKY